jgi:hypothetical protein
MPLDAQARRGGNGKARFVDYWLEDLHGRRIANAV